MNHLEPGQSAVVFGADGTVLYCVVPDEPDDVMVSRGALVAAALLLLPPAEIDAMIDRMLHPGPPTVEQTTGDKSGRP